MKKYIEFAFPGVTAGVLIGVMVYGFTVIRTGNLYENALYSGFQNYSDVCERVLTSYDEGNTDEAFSGMYVNFYGMDYTRLARIEDDGSFYVIYETDYDIVPVRLDIHNWIYITNNEEKLSQEPYHSVMGNGFELNIEHKKSDEIYEVVKDRNTSIFNSYNCVVLSDGFYDRRDTFCLMTEYAGLSSMPIYYIDSYYIDGTDMHIGKAGGFDYLMNKPKLFGKKWDFTDASKADLYVRGYENMTDIYGAPEIMGYYNRPDDFFESEGDLFLAKDMSDLSPETGNSRVISFSDNDNYYMTTYTAEDRNVLGLIKIIEINGNRYLVEYVCNTIPASEYYKSCYIVLALVMVLLCVGVPCLFAIKPYRHYKTAYENNLFKNNLIDSLAHNLKTPLQVLGGFAENLRDVTNEEDKNRYAESILSKTAEMNGSIEAILKTAEKNNLTLRKASVRDVFEQAASKSGIAIDISGDKDIPMDKEYLGQAVYCLIDNAGKYKSADSKIGVKIGRDIVITNKTSKDNFTPGTGLVIAGRIIEQHKLKLRTKIEDGIFEARITKK